MPSDPEVKVDDAHARKSPPLLTYGARLGMFDKNPLHRIFPDVVDIISVWQDNLGLDIGVAGQILRLCRREEWFPNFDDANSFISESDLDSILEREGLGPEAW